jgi:hypothetical protein
VTALEVACVAGQEADRRSWLVVFNTYSWAGPLPRSQAFQYQYGNGDLGVLVDGKLAGVAHSQDDVNIPLEPGRHTVRVGGVLWFRSPRIQVDLKPGEVARFTGGLPPAAWRRLVFGFFVPFRSLALVRQDGVRSP